MGAVWLRFQSELNSRWRAWLALALLAGIAGGLVLAAAAGARRTDTALDRHHAATRTADVYVGKGADFPNDVDFDEVEQLPQVADASRSALIIHWGRLPNGRPLTAGDIYVRLPRDERDQIAMNKPLITEGRLPRPGAVDEALVSEIGPSRDLRPGSSVLMRFATPDEFSAIVAGEASFDLVTDPETAGSGPLLTIRIVGVREAPDLTDQDRPMVYLSTAFFREYGDQVAIYDDFTSVRLKRGHADVVSFQRDVERLAQGSPVGFFAVENATARLQRSIHAQAQALWVAAIAGAIVTLLILGQALVRRTAIDSTEYPTLRALGMTRLQLGLLALTRAAFVGFSGAALALVVALGLSPLTPVGSARNAEPDRGLALDALFVGGGAAAVILLVLLAAAFPAWRAAGARGGVQGGPEPVGCSRRAALADTLARAGFPASAVAGVRMALERGGGRTAAPVVSTILGAVIAVAVVATALTFTASLDHLAATPALYGQNWDAAGNGGGGTDLGDELISALAAKTSIEGLAVGTVIDVEIEGKRAGLVAMESVKGSVQPTVIEGRAPSAPDEILLGGKTIGALGAEIGDTVKVSAGADEAAVRVVGRGVLPEFSIYTGISLSDGAAMTFEGLRQLVPEAARNQPLIRFAPGVDEETAIAELNSPVYLVDAVEKPVDIASFERVGSLPWVITGLFGAVAAAALAHTLVSLIRGRRRDLAVLKTLGFDRRQVFATVAWQSTTVAGIGLLVGLPLGVGLGRWAWNLFAENLGVVPEAVTPLWSVLAVIPAAILLANLVAALPGRVAARTRPALVLRAE